MIAGRSHIRWLGCFPKCSELVRVGWLACLLARRFARRCCCCSLFPLLLLLILLLLLRLVLRLVISDLSPSPSISPSSHLHFLSLLLSPPSHPIPPDHQSQHFHPSLHLSPYLPYIPIRYLFPSQQHAALAVTACYEI